MAKDAGFCWAAGPSFLSKSILSRSTLHPLLQHVEGRAPAPPSAPPTALRPSVFSPPWCWNRPALRPPEPANRSLPLRPGPLERPVLKPYISRGCTRVIKPSSNLGSHEVGRLSDLTKDPAVVPNWDSRTRVLQPLLECPTKLVLPAFHTTVSPHRTVSPRAMRFAS